MYENAENNYWSNYRRLRDTGYMDDFTPDFVLLHCCQNDLKKDITPQETTQA